MAQSTFTITFGEQAENHVGMQKIGKKADEGFTPEELRRVAAELKKLNVVCELIDLKIDGLVTEEACVLVIRNGVCELLGDDSAADELQAEQEGLEVDKKAFMRGRVVNKIARHNLCFDDESQEPDYENGKGRIIAFKDVPVTETVRVALREWFGEKADKLKGELNAYYNIKICSIGFHGDAERKRVIAVRLGAMFPLFLQWYQHSEKVGPLFEIELGHGDIYCMSEKATGHDWKKRIEPTLRHAAGSKKTLKLRD